VYLQAKAPLLSLHESETSGAAGSAVKHVEGSVPGGGTTEYTNGVVPAGTPVLEFVTERDEKPSPFYRIESLIGHMGFIGIDELEIDTKGLLIQHFSEFSGLETHHNGRPISFDG
jgi:hypothetical protein